MTSKTMLAAVRGMHCPNCVAKVNRAFSSVDGVTVAEADLDGQNARITYDPAVTDPERVMAGFVEIFGNRFELAILES